MDREEEHSERGAAVPRQEVGCAICARKDWLENHYRVYSRGFAPLPPAPIVSSNRRSHGCRRGPRERGGLEGGEGAE